MSDRTSVDRPAKGCSTIQEPFENRPLAERMVADASHAEGDSELPLEGILSENAILIMLSHTCGDHGDFTSLFAD